MDRQFDAMPNGGRADEDDLDRLPRNSAAGRTEQGEGNGGNLIERLLAGPDDAELTPREMALLEAHLKQPISYRDSARETGNRQIGNQ